MNHQPLSIRSFRSMGGLHLDVDAPRVFADLGEEAIEFAERGVREGAAARGETGAAHAKHLPELRQLQRVGRHCTQHHHRSGITVRSYKTMCLAVVVVLMIGFTSVDPSVTDLALDDGQRGPHRIELLHELIEG